MLFEFEFVLLGKNIPTIAIIIIKPMQTPAIPITVLLRLLHQPVEPLLPDVSTLCVDCDV